MGWGGADTRGSQFRDQEGQGRPLPDTGRLRNRTLDRTIYTQIRPGPLNTDMIHWPDKPVAKNMQPSTHTHMYTCHTPLISHTQIHTYTPQAYVHMHHIHSHPMTHMNTPHICTQSRHAKASV